MLKKLSRICLLFLLSVSSIIYIIHHKFGTLVKSRQTIRKNHFVQPGSDFDRNSSSVQMGSSSMHKSQSLRRHVWLSLSLCWSTNTKFHHKSGFPYDLATRFAILLWLSKTDVQILLQIVVFSNTSYTKVKSGDKFISNQRHDQSIQTFIKNISSPRVEVKIIYETLKKCVLTAQLTRLLPYVASANIQADDIVITSDVDTFVIEPNIFADLYMNDRYKIWLYQYQDTLVSGTTFNMNFIGMRAKLWKRILRNSTSVEALIDEFTHNSYLDLKRFSSWDYDQLIISYAILDSGICTIPSENKLWKTLNLKPHFEVDDSQSCFHGQGYEDCNRDRVYKVCKRWHFHSFERGAEITKKFYEITNNLPPDKGAKKLLNDVKIEVSRLFGFRN